MRAYELASYFWKGIPRRLNYRDSVEVYNGTVIYYVWGNPIAVLKDNILTVSDCGWKTWLTKTRLNNILYEIDMHLYSDREWYLHYREKSIIWEGEHQIDMNKSPFEITPFNLRRRNPGLSTKLRRLYQHVREFIKQNRIISTKTLEGDLVVCLDTGYGKGFMKDYVLLKTYAGRKLTAFKGVIHMCRAYKSAKAGDFRPFFNGILKKVKQEEILSCVEGLDIDLHELPKGVISALSIQKLLEGNFDE